MKTRIQPNPPTRCEDCEFYDPLSPSSAAPHVRCWRYMAAPPPAMSPCEWRINASTERLELALDAALTAWRTQIYVNKYGDKTNEKTTLPPMQRDLLD